MKTKTQSLAKILCAIPDENRMEDFLMGILTPVELEQINIRIQIIKMLKKDIPQHLIAEKLKIGVATVTRGSRMLKEGRFKDVL